MAKYIDKSALMAEIERRIADNKKEIERASHKNLEDYFEGYEDALVLLKQQYLDTIETKEVDLEKELDKYTADNFWALEGNNESPYLLEKDDMLKVAKHFYELGLAQKGE